MMEKEGYQYSRRDFLRRSTIGLGSMALGHLMAPADVLSMGRLRLPTAKRVIYLFMAGGPSQMELFDYKPALEEWHGQEIPDSIRGTQRNSGMVTAQSTFPLVRSFAPFKQYGQNGAWVSDLLPYTAQLTDDLCIVKSMYTEAINHEPAVTFMQTGSQINGRPSMGSWLSYGLGSENENMPSFVVLVSQGPGSQPLNAQCWGSGFLPSHHQGVRFRGGADPVLYLNNPEGIDPAHRRRTLDYISQLNEMQAQEWGDPEIESKINQYEMAFRMQSSVPGVVDLSKEPESVYELYGEDARTPGTYAANCLLARRLAEQDVRFIQLYHTGWDQHGSLPSGITRQAKATDQATAGLLQDLKQRGLLDDTLVIWGGEFGRTSFSQGQLTDTNYGRDHHPGCFTMWMAGGGVRSGHVHGETDELGYNVKSGGVHVHDLNATILHLMGIDHERLVYRHMGRRYRLTDVHGEVVRDLVS